MNYITKENNNKKTAQQQNEGTPWVHYYSQQKNTSIQLI